jgi:hypothetical protein
MSEQQQPQRKETILSETKLRLYADPVNGSDRAPQLIPDIFENNPRLRVRTNVQNDANKGYIEAAMNSKTFYKLTEGIRKLANNQLFDDAGNKLNGFRIENFGHPFMNGQRAKEKMIVSITKVEKNAQGIISIIITAGKNRPLIEFVFLEDDYHYFKDLNGNVMPASTSSSLAAIAWANMLEKYVAIALTEYVTPAWVLKRQQQQAQGGGYQPRQGGGNYGGGGNNYQQRQGGNNYGGNGGGGYQPASSSAAASSGGMDNFDIDIPI